MMRRRKASSSRTPKDWVYRSNINAMAPLTGFDGLGTYEPVNNTITTGFANATMFVLYDSKNAMKAPFATVAANLGVQPGAARAEGKRPVMHAVRGFINLAPVTWALGNQISLGWRIIAAEQDPGNGVGAVDGFYSMWTDQGFGRSPATYANEKRNLAEGRFMHVFSTSNDQAMFNVPIRWNGRWTLQPNYGLFLYVELGTGVNVRCQRWVRTLVTDEG